MLTVAFVSTPEVQKLSRLSNACISPTLLDPCTKTPSQQPEAYHVDVGVGVGVGVGVTEQIGVPLSGVEPQTQPIGGYPFAFS